MFSAGAELRSHCRHIRASQSLEGPQLCRSGCPSPPDGRVAKIALPQLPHKEFEPVTETRLFSPACLWFIHNLSCSLFLSKRFVTESWVPSPAEFAYGFRTESDEDSPRRVCEPSQNSLYGFRYTTIELGYAPGQAGEAGTAACL